MRSRKFLMTILLMSSLALATTLVAESPTPSAAPSTPSWADLPKGTPVTIAVEGYLPNKTTIGALEAEIGAQVDKAVQAAVAEERGRAAEAEANLRETAGALRAERNGWRAAGMAFAGLAAGAAFRDPRAELGGAALGGLLGLAWDLLGK